MDLQETICIITSLCHHSKRGAPILVKHFKALLQWYLDRLQISGRNNGDSNVWSTRSGHLLFVGYSTFLALIQLTLILHLFDSYEEDVSLTDLQHSSQSVCGAALTVLTESHKIVSFPIRFPKTRHSATFKTGLERHSCPLWSLQSNLVECDQRLLMFNTAVVSPGWSCRCGSLKGLPRTNSVFLRTW